MSANPQRERARKLIEDGQPAQALELYRAIESVEGPSSELEFEKGVCLAEMGRITEARSIARHLRNEGHVALAQNLYNQIPVEDAGGVDLGEELAKPIAPAYPVVERPSVSVPTIAWLIAAAVVILAAGTLIGSRMSRGHGDAEANADTGNQATERKQTSLAATSHTGARNGRRTGNTLMEVTEFGPPTGASDMGEPAYGYGLTGQWQCIDAVASIDQYVPARTQFKGEIALRWIVCYADGTTTMGTIMKDGVATNRQTSVKTPYEYRQYSGDLFLFIKIATPDPLGAPAGHFYVLKKVSTSTSGTPSPSGLESYQLAQNTNVQAPQTNVAPVQWEQGSLDLTGNWRSVDFVREPTQFVPGRKYWKDDLVIKGFECYQDGSSSIAMRWGNGMIVDLNSGYQAAYDVKVAGGKSYLFYPWINGDVTSAGQKSSYYILTR